MDSKETPLRVLVADDHALVRECICRLIDSQSDMKVVAEAKDGEEAWEQGRYLNPDVVVMDISMPKLTGAQATERLRASCPQTRILVVSAYADDDHVRQLLAVGAAGYLLKRSASADLVNAVRTVAQGGMYIDANVICQVVKNYVNVTSQDEHTFLSPREIEVLTLIAYGHSNREIAESLYVSIKTIEGHKARLSSKLGLETRADIVNYALRRGWLTSSN